MLLRHAVACFILIALARPARALDAQSPGPGWVEARRSDDLVIFYRDDTKLGAREVLAISEANVPPAVMFDVTEDYPHFREFMPHVREVKVLQHLDASDVVIYERISVPVISDRDCVLQVHREQGNAANGGVFRSRWSVVPGYEPLHDGVVRMQLSTGSWLMEPIDGGKRTRMTYRLLGSPGGSVPHWLTNATNTRGLPDLFKAVKARASKVLAAMASRSTTPAGPTHPAQ